MKNKLRCFIMSAISMLLLLGFSNSTAQVVVSQALPSDVNPDAGDTITVTINFDMTGMTAPDTLLGSYSADFNWNPDILAYVSNSGPLQGFTGFVNTTNADSGYIRFNGAKPTGQNGIFDVLIVTFEVVGFPGQSTILDLEYTAMAAAFTFNDLLPFLFVGDGFITIAGAANNPPVLDSIPDQTIFDEDTLDVLISAADPEGNAITLTANNLPSFGSLIDSGNGAGMIRFTPGFNQAGFYQNIEVIATDNGGPPLSDTTYFDLTVLHINIPPTITGLPDTIMFDANASTSLDIWAAVSDPETEDSLLTYNFLAAPDTLILSFNATSGILDISAKDTINNVNANLFIMVQDPQGAAASDTIFVMVNAVVGIDNPFDHQIPINYELAQNFPNPFNPVTHIRFGLPKPSTVEINLYNIMGQKVTTILQEYKPAGYHTINFNASYLASGIYFFSIKAEEFKDVKKMILMK